MTSDIVMEKAKSQRNFRTHPDFIAPHVNSVYCEKDKTTYLTGKGYANSSKRRLETVLKDQMRYQEIVLADFPKLTKTDWFYQYHLEQLSSGNLFPVNNSSNNI